MLLSDSDIAAAIGSGRIGIDPYEPAMMQPSSIDVRLGDTFLIPPTGKLRKTEPGQVIVGQPSWFLDPLKAADPHEAVTVPEGKAFCLDPAQFVLASTLEVVSLADDVVAEVKGKSSLARHGLIIESAGLVDPGFQGAITLELYNLAPRPILLWTGMKIGQLCFQPMTSPAARPYGSPGIGRYQGQRGPTAARAAIPVVSPA